MFIIYYSKDYYGMLSWIIHIHKSTFPTDNDVCAKDPICTPNIVHRESPNGILYVSIF